MKRSHRSFPREFKISVIRENEAGTSIAELSRKYEVHPTLISRWKKEYRNDPEGSFKGKGNNHKDEARVAELEKMVGQLYAENAFLKKTLTSLEKRLQKWKGREGRR